jgi:glutamyl-tRNA synthetase
VKWDEGPDIGGAFGPYRQSERKDIYLDHARQLIETGKAFYCFCKPERLEAVRQEQHKLKLPLHYDGTCREIPLDEAKARVASGEKYVIRFKTPREGSTIVRDLLRGDITVANSNLDDSILVKSDGWALYHLASMVDDHLMQISHVIRGSEWLGTFPLHSLIYRAFGWEEPVWMHLSVFLKPSGKGKMSKREAADIMKDGYSIFLKDMEGLGYTPEGVVNWIALMGWSFDDHTEFFRMYDLIEKFDLKKLNPSPAAINFTKLDYFNGLHIRNLPIRELGERLVPFFVQNGLKVDREKLEKIVPIIQERLVTLDDAIDFSGFFFRDSVDPSPQDLIAKGLSAKESALIARKAYGIIENQPTITTGLVEAPLRELVEDSGFNAGQVFGILRVAITGQKVSPPLFESMEIIGKEVILARIEEAIKKLENVIDP